MKLRPINKKADLSLSINAIVILILAITVMGLGLTFIRGLFKGATEKLGGALDATELTNPPTADKPLTVDQKIATTPGDKKTIQIGIYNPDSSADLAGVKPKIKSCVDSTGSTAATAFFSLAAPTQDIPKRGSAGFSVILTVAGTITPVPDTFICTIEAVSGDTAETPVPGVSASTFIDVK